MRAHMALGVALEGLCVLAGCQTATVRGPEGKMMTVEVPMAVTVQRGPTQPLTIEIERGDFTDPVTVSVSQLPAGVTVDKASKTVETDAATFMLKADKDAAMVVNQAVRVNVTGPGGMAATKYVKLTVKE